MMKNTCPDCGVILGEPHRTGCDVKRCVVCGKQRIQCNCEGHDHDAVPWTGDWPVKDKSSLDEELNHGESGMVKKGVICVDGEAVQVVHAVLVTWREDEDGEEVCTIHDAIVCDGKSCGFTLPVALAEQLFQILEAQGIVIVDADKVVKRNQ